MAKEEKQVKELTLYEKLSKIQQELKVPKSKFNSYANFKYRSLEDILEAVKPLLKKYGLFMYIEDKPVCIGGRYWIRATVYIRDIENTQFGKQNGYAREAESKTKMDDAQVTGMASTYARKYALNGLFLIDDTQDPDDLEPESPKAKKPEIKETKKGDEVLASRLRIKIKNALFVEDLEALKQEIADAGGTLTKEQFQSVVDEAKKKKAQLKDEFSNIDETDYE